MAAIELAVEFLLARELKVKLGIAMSSLHRDLMATTAKHKLSRVLLLLKTHHS